MHRRCMRRVLLVSLLTVPLVLTTIVRAWGYDGHRRINRQAARVLNGPFGAFLEQHEEALAWYGPVPDYNKKVDPNEFVRHFIDADYYDEYPFLEIPLDYDSLLAKYGEDDVRNWGSAPWAIQTSCDRIIELLKGNRFEEAIFHMGVLGHYVADLHMPLHTVKNYNGQFTGNDGVHFRWEGRLVDDYVPTILAGSLKIDIIDPLATAFEIVRESYLVHTRLLDADTKARKQLTAAQTEQLTSYNILPFEKKYLDVLYSESRDVLHDRLGKAVTRIAAYWLYCYKAAGLPDLPKK